jgi:hypothetical protein
VNHRAPHACNGARLQHPRIVAFRAALAVSRWRDRVAALDLVSVGPVPMTTVRRGAVECGLRAGGIDPQDISADTLAYWCASDKSDEQVIAILLGLPSDDTLSFWQVQRKHNGRQPTQPDCRPESGA